MAKTTKRQKEKVIRDIVGRLSKEPHRFEYKRQDGSPGVGYDLSIAVSSGTSTDFWQVTCLGEDWVDFFEGWKFDPDTESWLEVEPFKVGELLRCSGEYRTQTVKLDKYPEFERNCLTAIGLNQVSRIRKPTRPDRAKKPSRRKKV